MKNYKTILFLEDDAELIEALSSYFSELGYKVFRAYDALEAQDLVDGNSIDVIVTDLNMPCLGLSEKEISESVYGTLTGYIWIRNLLKNQESSFKGKIVIFSAYVEELRRSFPDAKNEAEIVSKSKPITEIIFTIQKYLS